MNKVQIPGIIQTGEAARRLGVTAPSVRRYFYEGKLEGMDTPLGLLLEAESVERLATQRAARTSGPWFRVAQRTAGQALSRVAEDEGADHE
jgi:hypothetical protein